MDVEDGRRLYLYLNIEALKDLLYRRVRELHVQKYPYNDFLFDTYEEA